MGMWPYHGMALLYFDITSRPDSPDLTGAQLHLYISQPDRTITWDHELGMDWLNDSSLSSDDATKTGNFVSNLQLGTSPGGWQTVDITNALLAGKGTPGVTSIAFRFQQPDMGWTFDWSAGPSAAIDLSGSNAPHISYTPEPATLCLLALGGLLLARRRRA